MASPSNIPFLPAAACNREKVAPWLKTVRPRSNA
jgi:hypothetical protein